MKALDIALKDLLHSFRTAVALVFMFVLPLLTTGLFYLAFGGLSSDGGFNLPRTTVIVANLDEPDPQPGGFSAGRVLAAVLESGELADLLQVTRASDAANARAAVDDQKADVAVIVPAGLTAAMFDPLGRASIELYQDPTLTIGPAIVKGIISQFADGFAGSRIGANVAAAQLTEQGVAVDGATLEEIQNRYIEWTRRTLGEDQQAGTTSALEIQSPPSAEEEATDELAQMLTLIMTGMMIFYAFFTGAASAQSILQEDEAGTLSRLFTTPTPQSTILGGKFLAVFVMLLVQVIVLVVVAALVFKIEWGEPMAVALATLGLVVLASSFGIFINSWLRDTKQAGFVFGGVLTVTGMLGISVMFVGGQQAASETTSVTDIVSLLVPQGWAMRGWQQALDGRDVSDVLVTVVVMLVLSAVFFAAGVFKFRKRFA